MRASENAAHLAPVGRPDDRAAEVASRRRLLQAVTLRPRVHVDVAVGAVVRAQAAADAVTFDGDLLALCYPCIACFPNIKAHNKQPSSYVMDAGNHMGSPLQLCS